MYVFALPCSSGSFYISLLLCIVEVVSLYVLCVALFSASCSAPPRLLLPPPLIVQTCNINFSKIIEFQRKLRYPPSLVYQHPAWVDAMFGYSAATVSGGHITLIQLHDFSLLLCFVKIMELSFDIPCSLVDDSYRTSQSESPLEVAADTITKVGNEYSCFF